MQSQTGGKGGNAASNRYSTSWMARYAGGGAGNIGGTGAYTFSSGNGTAWTDGNGTNGTGGLLMIYTHDLYNGGEITANGSDGGKGRAKGGSSGGGSVNIFANIVVEKGEITANGGALGGKGGNGTVTINELGSVLNYPEKRITLNIKDTYTIDKLKLSYIKLNDIQTEDINLGNIVYETLGDNLVEVNTEGEITPKALGTTRVKITDETNGNSTYIMIDIIEQNAKAKISAGENFVVTLRENGTVWSYGCGANGRLGNGTKTNELEPVQVIDENDQGIENIVDISAGSNIAAALTKDGKVYTWGLYNYIDETQKNRTEERLKAKLENNLENIVVVDCNKENIYAIDSEGHVYIWGKGYSEPTILNTNTKMVDISGDILLGENGKVYNVKDTNTEIEYLNNVCDISKGENHSLFLMLNGKALAAGEGTSGELGNKKQKTSTSPVIVRDMNGYLENVVEISAGSKASMALVQNGKAYAFGDNTNQKLGITGDKILFATQIEKLQYKNEEPIELTDIEIVEVGKNNSCIADKDGFVYSVRFKH